MTAPQWRPQPEQHRVEREQFLRLQQAVIGLGAVLKELCARVEQLEKEADDG